ncbi:hypothetical protein AgCh_016626 [Apium graveolens]
MSRYVLKQRKYAGEEPWSKKPRLDVPESKPEKISPRKEKTEFVERAMSSETSIPETKPFIETNVENQSPAKIRGTAKVALPAGATASGSGAGVAELEKDTPAPSTEVEMWNAKDRIGPMPRGAH